MSKNFEFLIRENQELYMKCCYAEQFAKTYPNNSLVETRKVLEFFLQRVCKLNNIQFTAEENPYKSDYPSLHIMIKKTVYDLNIFTRDQKKDMDEIRKHGNGSAHAGEFASTKQSISQIKAMHELIRQYYQSKYPSIAAFDERFIPIDSMIPITNLPVERDEACTLKLHCKIVNEETGNELYYIVRQYEREQIEKDRTFVLRDMFTLEKLSQGGVGAKNLVKYNRIDVQKQNDLLFTCFEISRDAESLERFALEKLSVPERLQMLSGIVNGVEELHTNSIPIVHRYLRPSSIFVGRNRSPQICNFEYAKLDNPQQATVRYKVEARTDPYTAPELSRGSTVTLWPSVDIYSLAVIIIFVFGLPVNGELNPDQLKKLKISEPFIEMVHDMLSDVAGERPSIQEVKRMIGQEAARHA
ncbi:protein kinase domain-containing protein [Paenibacillus ginsengarvi]|uniref:DUF4145 domain-containing protein n=1 Tax=Paenibacillus ginsengarvi TaxID=400777 RepID=A0A3B0BVI7_9BACL|nr:protein kinase [Paenibacillus ginsengarvi]RKN77072.1 DUF4145 domain-containing protein [Paenibacillus ginsengarvi]